VHARRPPIADDADFPFDEFRRGHLRSIAVTAFGSSRSGDASPERFQGRETQDSTIDLRAERGSLMVS
jgi:hypothetical protein